MYCTAPLSPVRGALEVSAMMMIMMTINRLYRYELVSVQFCGIWCLWNVNFHRYFSYKCLTEYKIPIALGRLRGDVTTSASAEMDTTDGTTSGSGWDSDSLIRCVDETLSARERYTLSRMLETMLLISLTAGRNTGLAAVVSTWTTLSVFVTACTAGQHTAHLHVSDITAV